VEKFATRFMDAGSATSSPDVTMNIAIRSEVNPEAHPIMP